MGDVFLITNNAVSTLAAGITNVATSIPINTGDGALFPSPGASQRFRATLFDSAGNIEIIECTTRTGDTFNPVTRGLEGTAARAWNSGDGIELRLTKEILEQIPQSTGVVQVDLNADQLDGSDANAAKVNNTIPIRNGSGSINSDLSGDVTGDLAGDVTGDLFIPGSPVDGNLPAFDSAGKLVDSGKVAADTLTRQVQHNSYAVGTTSITPPTWAVNALIEGWAAGGGAARQDSGLSADHSSGGQGGGYFGVMVPVSRLTFDGNAFVCGVGSKGTGDTSATRGSTNGTSGGNTSVTLENQNDQLAALEVTDGSISFTAPSTIGDTNNGFGVFTAGERIRVVGTASNDGFYTVGVAVAGSITIDEATLSNESAGASMTIRRVDDRAIVARGGGKGHANTDSTDSYDTVTMPNAYSEEISPFGGDFELGGNPLAIGVEPGTAKYRAGCAGGSTNPGSSSTVDGGDSFVGGDGGDGKSNGSGTDGADPGGGGGSSSGNSSGPAGDGGDGELRITWYGS